MAEETTQQNDPAAGEGKTDPADKNQAEGGKSEIDWKAESRKWENRAKENKSAADELKKIKEGELSEIEKANKRAQEAEAELDRLKAKEDVRTWASEVSKETGIPASALRGSTKEELEAHAETLKEFIKPEPTAPVVGSDGKKPKSPGASGGDWLREAFANS